MWYKNLLVYRFNQPFQPDLDAIQHQLQQHAFKPCGQQDMFRFGWVPLIEGSDELSFIADGRIAVCARREEKVLPGAVINEKLLVRVRELEDKEQRRIGRKEKAELKEAILFECLPQAFTRSRRIYATIDLNKGRVLVDTSSSGRAEDVLKLLRESLGTLPVVPMTTALEPTQMMTQWLQEHCIPAPFQVGSDADLKEPSEEGGIVRCRRHELHVPEVKQHLDQGKQVVKLALHWNDGIEFMLNQDLSISRLKFNDELLAEADERAGDDAAQRFDADFNVMHLNLSECLDNLLEALGSVREARI